MHHWLPARANEICAEQRGNCDFQVMKGYPVLVNDDALTSRVRSAAVALVGAENVVDMDIRIYRERPSAARKALSAIYRTGERFGVGYVVDVLRGKPEPRIVQNGHDRLTTFGIGKDLSETEWRGLMRQLAVHGLITVDLERYGALRLEPSCRPLLRGETTFAMRRDAPVAKGKKERKERRAPGAAGTASVAGDEELIGRLRALRLDLAAKGNVPPYVVFHDRTMLELAARRPRAVEDLAGITGLGEVKIARYGAALVALIAAYDRERSAGQALGHDGSGAEAT